MRDFYKLICIQLNFMEKLILFFFLILFFYKYLCEFYRNILLDKELTF